MRIILALLVINIAFSDTLVKNATTVVSNGWLVVSPYKKSVTINNITENNVVFDADVRSIQCKYPLALDNLIVKNANSMRLKGVNVGTVIGNDVKNVVVNDINNIKLVNNNSLLANNIDGVIGTPKSVYNRVKSKNNIKGSLYAAPAKKTSNIASQGGSLTNLSGFNWKFGKKLIIH